jgi:hypothetical protein
VRVILRVVEAIEPNLSLEPQHWSLPLLLGVLTYPIDFYKRLVY